MPVLAVGLDFKRAPLDLLERLSFDSSDVPKALHAARASEHVREAVVLSTCNRTEVYAVVDAFHAGAQALRQFLSDFHHVPVEEFADKLSVRFEDEAVEHLFAVASGIESMAVGEPQILAQVRAAFKVAGEEGSVGSTLSALFRQAIRVGRRARAETEIARSAAVFAEAGATIAREALGTLRGRTVLVIGAGKMSDLAVVAIAREGARILVANRTHGRAESVAARAGGAAVPMAELPAALSEADLVLTSTASHEPVITREVLAAVMRQRPDRPLIVLDFALPRDVEPAAGEIEGVSLRDLEGLREAVAPGADQLNEVAKVRAIVRDEVPKFSSWQRTHALAPLLAALQARAEDARAGELRRAQKALAMLDDREREVVETLTRSIVARLLHGPVTVLKDKVGSLEGDALARALRVLYRLDDDGEG